MGAVQVNLRQPVVLRLSLAEAAELGVEGDEIRLPAGLVTVDERLMDHWYLKAHVDQSKRPVIGNSGAQQAGGQPVDLAEVADFREWRAERLVELAKETGKPEDQAAADKAVGLATAARQAADVAAKQSVVGQTGVVPVPVKKDDGGAKTKTAAKGK